MQLPEIQTYKSKIRSYSPMYSKYDAYNNGSLKHKNENIKNKNENIYYTAYIKNQNMQPITTPYKLSIFTSVPQIKSIKVKSNKYDPVPASTKNEFKNVVVLESNSKIFNSVLKTIVNFTSSVKSNLKKVIEHILKIIQD